MIKPVYQTLMRFCAYIGFFLVSTIATAKVLPSAAYREQVRQQREFNSYEWFCTLSQNDYDYVHILNDLKLAINAYNTAYLTTAIGSLLFSALIFFVIILARFFAEQPLKLSTAMVILALLSVFPTYVIFNIDNYTQVEAEKVIDLRTQINKLEPVGVDVLKYCKPNIPNVHIELE